MGWQRITHRTASEWTAGNYTLLNNELGVESDTQKQKLGDGTTTWTSLGYNTPIYRAFTTVSTNVGTKQALLAAVPTGKVRIVTQVVARNASADLSLMADDLQFGFDASPSNWGYAFPGGINLLTAANKSMSIVASALSGTINAQTDGAAGDVLGCMFLYTAITATVDIDVFYYDVDA